MELSERKKVILSSIIRAYISTGEPVGSKTLCEMFDFGVSSATLRNEMSDLCALGFLEQPHTSAGRVPSDSGYRLYASKLLDASLSDEIKASIDRSFDSVPADPEHIPQVAADILSKLTGFTALSATLSNSMTYIRHAEILPISRHTALLAVVTSDGAARNRICRSSSVLNEATLGSFRNILANRIVGAKLDSLTPAYMQTVISRAGTDAFSVVSLMSALFSMVEDIRHKQVSISGESNLFHIFKNDTNTAKLLDYLSRNDNITSLFNDSSSDINIIFGSDTGIEALKNSCLIVAKYGVSDEPTGRIGIIGPTRMAYDNIIPGIKYFANQLGKSLTAALKDMED